MKVIVVSIVLLLVAAAGASDSRASDGVVQSRATVSSATQAAVGSCKTVTAWRGFKLLIGVFAWKYFARIRWCFNGRKITEFGYRRWAEVYVPTWDFKGDIGKSGFGGVGTRYARRWTQGKFQQCAAWCIQTKTPWVEILVRRDGTWAWASGGA